MSSHSELKRSSSSSGSSRRTLKACSWYVRALRVDLLAREQRPGRRAAARVADPRGEVADDEDHLVAEVLELAQLLQDDGVAEVDVGRRRVEAELHAQLAALARGLLELALETPSGRASTAFRVRNAAASEGAGSIRPNASVVHRRRPPTSPAIVRGRRPPSPPHERRERIRQRHAPVRRPAAARGRGSASSGCSSSSCRSCCSRSSRPSSG